MAEKLKIPTASGLKNQIIILAAGKGMRMHSEYPKVLHIIEGKPIILHILETVTKICEKPTLVVGYRGEEVIEITGNQYHYVWQKQQLGTGHAVQQAKDDLKNAGFNGIIVLYGDHPFVSSDTLHRLVDCFNQREPNTALCMTVFTVPNFENEFRVFYKYGRISRDEPGKIVGTIEFKDATEEQRAWREVNIGYYCFDAVWLWENISKLDNKNNAKEYYLTDLVKMAVDQGKKIRSIEISHPIEGMGVNTQEELEAVEGEYEKNII